jgi:hypothetical protein
VASHPDPTKPPQLLDEVGPVEGPREVSRQRDEVLELGRVAGSRRKPPAVKAQGPEELRADPEGSGDDEPVSRGVPRLAREARGLLDARVLGEREDREV